RLRARRQLTELRVKDLRFTANEAASFLNQVMHLNLAAEDIAALETRTEGWIAGLQLAALSIQGREDAAGFIEAFTGSHRFVLDYLVEEVLQRQPATVRHFLLQTAILNKLSAPLCDAVTASDASRTLLDALERGNLFIIPLDDRRQWYRYHHLFADALHAHLRNEPPDVIARLHVRACDWYAHHHLPHDAIRHALAAPDFDRASDLLEQVWPEMDEKYQSVSWVSWVKALPEHYIVERPMLSLGYAWALLNRGDVDAAEVRLRDAERRLGTAMMRDERFRALPAAIASARAYRALTLGDVHDAMDHARQAIDQSPGADHPSHRQGVALMGVAQWASGDLEAADAALHAFMAAMQQADNRTDAMGIAFVLTDIRITLGRLRDTLSMLEHLVQFVTHQDAPPPLGFADVYRSLGELQLERGDLPAAAEHLLRSESLGAESPLPNWHYRLCVSQARLKMALGDFDAALDLLDEAAWDLTPAPLPIVRPVAALRARVWLRQGKLGAALAWAHAAGLSLGDALTYLREFEHITLARVLIAQHSANPVDESMERALQLLDRLQQAAEAGGRIGSLIEILIVRALALAHVGAAPAALVPLQRALTLAEPDGWVRPFADEGAPMAALLQQAANRGIAPGYSRQLQAAMAQTAQPQIARPAAQTPDQPLTDPLSDRELDVLKLLDTELTGPEIARELMISLNTLRTHTKNIYSKLGVNSRRAAVRRAEALGLL
ncbi:MAG: helix-turn-helix transcriptional regulator, partial [Chloroflexi bacterium]|nr:helix-turn-helix transcriptional regulator [Chloroflexota bacterium]